jgi:hypothetical protein
MGCQHLNDVYELFLLGTASEDVAGSVREHVSRGCVYCLEHLKEAAQTVYLLSQPAKLARPDPKLKSQLLHRLRKK